MRKKNLRASFRYAYKGLTEAISRQSHMLYLAVAMIVILIGGLIVKLSYIEWLILLLALGLPAVVELINTAFEAIVDSLSPHYNPSVKIAKDVSAGAVLLSLIIAGMLITFVFSERVHPPPLQTTPSPNALLKTGVGFLLLLLLISISKTAKNTKGLGWEIDAQSAIGFFSASALYLLSRNILVLPLGLLLALMITFNSLKRSPLLDCGVGIAAGLGLSLFLFIVV